MTPPTHKQGSSKAPWVVAIVLLAAIGGGYWWTHRGAKPEKKAPPPVPVLAATVTKKAVPLSLKAIGNVEAYNSVLVRALASGEVRKVAFREGQPVKKGQLLYEIDPGPGQAGLDQAMAALARDQVTANNARAEARRYAGLLKQGFVTREQTEQLQAQAAALEQTLAADRAAIANAKITLGYTTIRSPIDGVAGALQVNVGNLVKAADQTPLVVINQVHPIYVDFSIPEAQVDEVKRFSRQHKLTVIASPRGNSSATSGVLTFMDNAVDTSTGTLKLKGTFANPDGRLVPGQYVDVELVLDQQPGALTVPSQAVMTGQGGTFVFVIGQDDTVQQRAVKLERQAGQDDVIKEGLQAGEQVVTDGQLALVPGSKVKLRTSLTPPQKGEGGQGHKGHKGAGAAQQGGQQP